MKADRATRVLLLCCSSCIWHPEGSTMPAKLLWRNSVWSLKFQWPWQFNGDVCIAESISSQGKRCGDAVGKAFMAGSSFPGIPDMSVKTCAGLTGRQGKLNEIFKSSWNSELVLGLFSSESSPQSSNMRFSDTESVQRHCWKTRIHFSESPEFCEEI